MKTFYNFSFIVFIKQCMKVSNKTTKDVKNGHYKNLSNIEVLR